MKLEINDLFSLITQRELSPNQFYLLVCIHENIQSKKINLDINIDSLVRDKWIVAKNTEGNESYEITLKGVELLEEAETLFKNKKKRSLEGLLGADYKENISKYNEIFPPGKLDNGRNLRCSVKNLEPVFKWFFENHKYTWETIFKATGRYIENMEMNDHTYTKTSRYFILKREGNIPNSLLADHCWALTNRDLGR